MKTVKEIHDFFMKHKGDKGISLGEFMDTVPGFIVEKYETGGENCNWTMAQEYYHICEKMCDDLLLVNVHAVIQHLIHEIYGRKLLRSIAG